MAWELYKKTRTYSTEEEVTITKSGLLTLNPSLFENRFKDKPYADLYYDATKNLIGIKPVTKAGDFSYKVSPSSNGKFGMISGQAFLKTYQIPHTTSQKFRVKFEDGMVVFPVKSAKGA
jgi:hypothetical protein